MIGMDAVTGRPLDGLAHLRQSIARILSTPIGTRVGRRDFGSLVPELIDQPMNDAGRLRLFAATALALSRWEPRIRLERIGLTREADGAWKLTLDSRRLDVPAATERTRLTFPLRPAGGSLIAYA